MDLLFELLAEIDRGNDEIIFFADEGGSWQVGLDEEKVMSAYFSSLAATATPEGYANSVRILIKECYRNNFPIWLALSPLFGVATTVT